MLDENSLGPLGPNIISIEPVSETEYSVQGQNFVTGFEIAVRNGVEQRIEGATVTARSGNAFTLTLPFATTGPWTLTVANPDGRTSTERFATPGTTVSNAGLRVNS